MHIGGVRVDEPRDGCVWGGGREIGIVWMGLGGGMALVHDWLRVHKTDSTLVGSAAGSGSRSWISTQPWSGRR